MKEIKDKINNLTEKISQIENSNKKILKDIVEILKDITTVVETTNLRQDYLEENMKYIDEDLSDIQEEIFEEVSIEDLIEMDDEFIEVKCSNCEQTLFLEKETIENKKIINCPFCHENTL
ncbi:CD1247 N-terminal domain-containing protein [Clostridium sp.]|uniref:CD1247 N-terminal domain-containing protein n=1 Tax=Clostridium sp. TaxID=1506 RepID=UPI0026392700|nr:CD1247 N-terminal domain-containing protein [Clostridium sp.]